MKVFAAAEHQVLEQVREAGLAGLLVLGPDVVPNVDGHDGGLMIFVNEHGQAVVEHEFLVRDVDAGGLGKGGGAQQQCREKFF